ncbi:MAG: creatininase family protein, partial [Anaerolineae bacterium]
MSVREEYRYNRLTWPEMNEAIAMQKVVLLPVGSTEQHGPHLPLDVDAFLVESVCLEVGRRAADRVLVLPT